MSGPGEAFDPYKHLNITINDDGTCTRHFNVPDVEPDPGPSPGMPTASKDVTVNHQTGVTVRIFRPTNLPSNDNTVARLPIILHFHGSGWVLFSSNSVSNHASCSQMASELTVILVSVSYRLAPEHRLPAPYDDALDALLWVKQQAVDPNGEPWLRDYADFSRCYVYGSSNGANIAFHVALRALDHVLTPLKIDGCVFYQPLLGGETRTKSELRHFADPVMPVPALDVIWELALPKGVDRDHRYCNPTAYLPHREKVGRLGRCLVIGYGGDTAVDRQQDFVKMLVTAGVKVEARFDDAGFHGIELVDPRRVVALLSMIQDFINQ
ncbi:PREDICTED: probable carboxylesterase 9 [Tarenaya hassleriana]|uniref:probable carboxylesterase 9 n=1 Tax=Tarenaya hassleriana TaxID=28532 RepID=UPI00053C40B7|nr:PREDICTED: probable carboxylesterase 9 [Tarenaya hassleriana]